MTGLHLEPFLRLLQADVGAWLTLGLVVLLLGLIAWTGWGARRVLRKCLVLSVLAHLGLAFYGGEELSRLISPGMPDGDPSDDPGIREIRVSLPSLSSGGGSEMAEGPGSSLDGRAGGLAADRDLAALALLATIEPEGRDASRPRPPSDERGLPLALGRIEAPEFSAPEPQPEPALPIDLAERAPAFEPDAEPDAIVEPSAADLGDVAVAPRPEGPRQRPADVSLPDPDRLAARPGNRDRPDAIRPAPRGEFAPPLPELDLPEPALGSRGDRFDEPLDLALIDPRASSEADPEAVAGPDRRPPTRRPEEAPLELPEADLRISARPAPERAPARMAERAAPAAVPDLDRLIPGNLPDLPGVRGVDGGLPLREVPEVYRPRLDPNRPELARRAGASAASEEAVELALDWLARHQDADGRWNAGTARYRDGSPAPGEASFTAHCPPGDICHGECFYWEADTAVTGLALLAFLGSGYTHLDGKYTAVVGRGIDFLLSVQQEDGDLRGQSRAVGMYCHAMASLALSEAYALSGDPQLKAPVERAVAFLAESQYPGLMGWRYLPRGEIRRVPAEGGQGWEYDPHPPVGDTSVLGWVVMVLKSASEVGVEVPPTAVQSARQWLRRVADGEAEGLARYQPSRPADPVMTAEAWVCRQFLGFGGPGEASEEAAASLLEHPPSADSFNVYYWYYATLAMYQNGGPAWRRWNDSIRDTLVGLQHREGHKAGSWDPDPSRYGTHGGRVYSTALAAMTLEVYYRYLRLYVSEGGVAEGSPLAPTLPRSGDREIRRSGGVPPR